MRYYITKNQAILGNYSTSQVLKEDELEFSFDLEIINYHFEGDTLIDDTTQADRDLIIENEIEESIKQDLEKDIQKGIEASNLLKTYLKRNLTVAQYKNARIIVLPVWIALRNGDFDIALDEMNTIEVTNEPYITMKQTIINKLNEY